ncbi:MAG: hypothetical protein GKR94_19395 [Gammaproteobacteria bacterium]|nr:hypothetical protein [Gammaproteobacteria bacterium]
MFERCSEPLLSMFLGEALSRYLGSNLSYICPELPLKKSNNQSTNIDFAFWNGESGWLLVEVKTTTQVPRPKQLEAYHTASLKTVASLVDDVRTISRATTNNEKYAALVSRIEMHAPHNGHPRFLCVSPHRQNPVEQNSDWLKWISFAMLFEGFASVEHPELWAIAGLLFLGPPT